MPTAPPAPTPSTRGATGISTGRERVQARCSIFVIDTVDPATTCSTSPPRSPRRRGADVRPTNPANTGTATDHPARRRRRRHRQRRRGTSGEPRPSPSSPSPRHRSRATTPTTATGNVGINVNTTADGVLQRGTDDTLFGAAITDYGTSNATGTCGGRRHLYHRSVAAGSVVPPTDGNFTSIRRPASPARTTLSGSPTPAAPAGDVTAPPATWHLVMTTRSPRRRHPRHPRRPRLAGHRHTGTSPRQVNSGAATNAATPADIVVRHAGNLALNTKPTSSRTPTSALSGLVPHRHRPRTPVSGDTAGAVSATSLPSTGDTRPHHHH